MDEKAEGEDNDSGDYADCDCVIEWREAGGELRVDMCCGRGRGGEKNSLEWISFSFLLIFISTLCIHE